MLSRSISPSMSSSGACAPTSLSPRGVPSSSPVSFSDTTNRPVSSANTTSPVSQPNFSASSSTVGSGRFFFSLSSVYAAIFPASAFAHLETFTAPSSRRKRLISPMIMGTAYVEKRTPYASSNPATAFKKPIAPSCIRSSYSSLPLKRLTTERMRGRFSSTRRSFALSSPSCARFMSPSVSS